MSILHVLYIILSKATKKADFQLFLKIISNHSKQKFDVNILK